MKPLKRGALTVIVCFYSFIFLFPAIGQNPSSCPNSNFSLGDFTGWQGYYGDFWNPAMNVGFAPTRHTIIKAPASMDPYTNNGLNPVPPGEAYSLRLGNEDSGAEAEQIRYSIDVTEETNLFIYKYAVVLEDPNHAPEKQPNFTIEVADNLGTLIDSVCGFYYVYAHQGMPTWHSTGEVVWKDWTIVGIDLTQYIGRTVSIKFTTRDCSESGHFGYAYLSAYCSQLKIEFGYCPNDTVATVTAPPGFTYLWANGSTTQSTTIHNPVYGMIASCELTSAQGCKVTITGEFKPTIVKAAFGCPSECVGTPVQFSDSSTINQNKITNWKWDFGDGTSPVAGIQNPQHVYSSDGPFYATLIASSTDGCPDTIKKQVPVIANPDADFTTSEPCGVITHDTLFFNGQVQLEVPQGYDHYTWNTGDSTHSIPVSKEGLYAVTIVNGGLCSTTDSVLMLYCYVPLIMPDAFTPDNDGLNDLFRPVTLPEKINTFHMFIFDRWGRLIFETQDISKGWDGMIKGKPAPLGVYCFSLSYRISSGIFKDLGGTVTLLR